MKEKGFRVIKSDEGNVTEPPGETIREIFSDEKVGIGIAEAETRDANLHYHEEMDEIYFVLEGKGKMEIGDDILDLEEKDLVYIPSETKHRAYSENETFSSLVISSPPWKDEDHYEV